MSDIVSNINSLNHLALVMMIPLAMMIGGTMIAIITVIACQWRRVRLAEIEASLKQQMLDKGMSAAEIDQVIKASREANGTACASSTGNASLDKTKLTKQMIDNGYEAKDIELVLKASEQSQNSVVAPHLREVTV